MLTIPNKNIRLSCIVSGRVQRVMYRDFVLRHAKKIHLTGYVTNLPDGSVRVVVEGDGDKVKDFLKKLQEGPVFAKVKNVNEAWSEYTGEFEGFNILYKNLWDRI